MTYTEDPTTVPPAPKEQAAVNKLEVLLDKKIYSSDIPMDTAVRVLPDGSIRIGRFVAVWRRMINSLVIWIQAVAGILAALWLAIPQEQFIAILPTKYVAWGTIIYAVVTALARMRTI